MSRGVKIKELEEFPRRLKIFFVIIILLLIIGTGGFRILSEDTIKDSSFRALQTVAFMFKEDSSTMERFLEIFLAVVGVFIIWWVLWSVADMILDGNLKKYLKRVHYSFIIRKMKDHIIIVGGGRVGLEISRMLSLKNVSFIIIELNPKTATAIKKKNYTVVEGDALDENVFKTAGIEAAAKIVLTLPKTESNIVMTLAAKELNPNIAVYSRCQDLTLVSKLKKAGAKTVIVPELVAAEKIAKELTGQ